MIASGYEAQIHVAETEMKSLEKKMFSLKNESKNDREAVFKAAQEFESYMMSFMFRQMQKSVPKSEFLGGGNTQDMFMGLYIDEVSKRAQSGNRGLAQMITQQYAKQMGEVGHQEIKTLEQTQKEPSLSLTDQLDSFSKDDQDLIHFGRVMHDLDQMIGKLEKHKTSDFGMRMHPIAKKERFHHGIDFGLAEGTPVEAPSSGRVVFAGTKGGYGNTVIVDHGNKITTLYAHLSEIQVSEGDQIDRNHQLGRVGTTGVSTGPHLHFEVRKDGKPLDPVHLKETEK